MKTGSLVKGSYSEKIGVVLRITKVFTSKSQVDVMWCDGTIRHSVWSFDLEVING